MVREEGLRRELGDIYRKASKIAEAMYAARGRPGHLTETQFQRLMHSGVHLWEHMGEAPVILIPCLRRPAIPPAESLPEEMRARYDAELIYAAHPRSQYLGAPIAIRPTAPSKGIGGAENFVPVTVPSVQKQGTIRIEVSRSAHSRARRRTLRAHVVSAGIPRRSVTQHCYSNAKALPRGRR